MSREVKRLYQQDFYALDKYKVAYAAGGKHWVHVAHPSSANGHFDDFIKGSEDKGQVPRATVLRDTALQVEDCKEVKDGRGRWDGHGPVGARPPRWRRRVHARAPTADVGAPQA